MIFRPSLVCVRGGWGGVWHKALVYGGGGEGCGRAAGGMWEGVAGIGVWVVGCKLLEEAVGASLLATSTGDHASQVSNLMPCGSGAIQPPYTYIYLRSNKRICEESGLQS